ncbi:MAG TPA: carbohydrate ABC transporter permease, partial [Candidatus Limnocylindria bacterium]|nr:carbohydrate ABC transporter permease [Candidatus Limnocylindria bacterium]
MKKFGFIGFVLAIGVFSLAPFLWFVLTSFKSATEISAIPPVLVPSFHGDNYRAAIEQYSLLGYIANSVIVATVTTAICIAIASLAAFALARFHWRWGPYYLML